MRTEDGNIIQECLNGKPQAFGMLVDKYKEGVYAFVYAELRDFQDAQDVTQEVFLQAYRDLRSLRRWESFVFWLYRIARRRCIQWFRVSSRRVDREYIEDQGPEVMDAHSLDSYRDSQLSESLGEALDSLPEIHREVLLLHYFGGMNSKEIASAIGTSPGAVRVRLTRARAQLREEMVAMMDTAFEGQKIPAGFTLRIVEAVKRIKIHPMPRMAGLPWGLSLAAGIIITVMSLNPHMNISVDKAIPTGSPLPVGSKVLKTGEIPVEILKVSQMPAIASKQGDGQDGGMKPSDQQRAFHLAPAAKGGTWKPKADMPTARESLSASVVNGKIYAIGGWPGPTQTVEEYDPVKDRWTKKADMPKARGEFSTSVVDGKIYAIGGWPGPLRTVEEYDPVADIWTKKADMPAPARGLLSTSVVNGKIYVIGGYDGQRGMSTVEEYDPAADTWTKKADMPTARVFFSTSVVNDKIYAIGGGHAQEDTPYKVTEEYDLAKDTWTKRADMPTARAGLTTGVLNGKIYAIGGAESYNNFDLAFPNVEVYDPALDKWEKGLDMPTARAWLSSSVANGKIYVIGGRTPRAVLSVVEEYTPEGWPLSISPQLNLPAKWGRVKSD